MKLSIAFLPAPVLNRGIDLEIIKIQQLFGERQILCFNIPTLGSLENHQTNLQL